MAESTVLVSLIERIGEHVAREYEGDATLDAMVFEVRALLSQPTPTAERDDLLSCLELGDDGHNHWDTDALDRLLERQMGELPAAPPSIADMVPGTTFVENVLWTVTGTLSSGVVVAHSESGEMRFADRFDPSTIRDVTPPSTESTK